MHSILSVGTEHHCPAACGQLWWEEPEVCPLDGVAAEVPPQEAVQRLSLDPCAAGVRTLGPP